MAAMTFWGVEVRAGEPLKVEVEDVMIHLSQVSLGEVKKDKNEAILISVKVADQKFALGTLSAEKFPQLSFDLVFEKNFEISHNGKHGSVYFTGYKSSIEEYDGFSQSESDDDDEAIPLDLVENGKPKPLTISKPAKTESTPLSLSKGKVTIVEPKKDDKSEDSEDDSDESDEESDEADKGKKRAAEPVTPASGKKAKLGTPQKTGGDGKKGGGHVDTPHPSKKSGKTPANNDKSKPQTLKSVSQVVCKSCSKTFNSDTALQSHSKAKHTSK
ncbi:hypothetical protein GIB67_034070 [Kingdonia uniflora]|uniref:C2H2-type domain-containing protein n=1 Tax=Kingdonia uniflora TaxID=39325 RepID=A0A7J7M648_9MAGN|nr:hypothetical protein GIB67_034070 [Kingdonia uniflora]